MSNQLHLPARKPRIIICGQKPRRHEELERAFGDRARLSFWHDENLHMLLQRARHADMVFVCVNASDHKTEFTLRKAGCALRRVGGATASLKAAIDEYLAGAP